MKSIQRIAVSMIVSLTVIGSCAYVRYETEAIEVGEEHRYYATIVERRLSWHPKRRWVAWLGDSTMRPRPDLGFSSYPLEIGSRINLLGFGNWEITLPGLDPFHHYFLLDPILDLEPDLLVLAATPPLLHGPKPGSEQNYLCAFIALRSIPEAVTLPFHARGMTIPDVLACPALRDPQIQNGLRFIDGLRRIFSEAEFWGAADYQQTPPDFLGAERAIAKYRKYGRPLTENIPTMRALEASVARATSRGIPTLVVISAIPVDVLTAYGVYDDATMDRSIRVIRRVVERAGGRVLDLHDLIPADEMRDNSSHLNEAGIKHVADILTPTVISILNSTAPPASTNH